MAISYEFWLGNLLEAAAQIADEEAQVRRGLAADAHAWERPVELLLTLEDINFELFIEEHRNRFSAPQLAAATELYSAAVQFECGSNGWRDPRALPQHSPIILVVTCPSSPLAQSHDFGTESLCEAIRKPLTQNTANFHQQD